MSRYITFGDIPFKVTFKAKSREKCDIHCLTEKIA